MTAYATPAQMFERKRVETINDLVSDDGVRQSRVDLLSHPHLLTALADASGAIDAALTAGRRYSTGDLADLTGNAASLLQRVCCDIAMALLYERNPGREVEQQQRYRELSESHLQRLRSGEDVFQQQAAGAGLPTVDGPSAVDYARLNLLPDRTRNFYPGRDSRLPRDRR
ncbi:phage protein Gp36 family protein [Lignipirellula cremea]|uniref:Uncharacterized protein n=1 Tax=Lignipirellula cremea TaxID=2528010 RepID=A0A518E0A1_9BACT|nr:phage protein Gp36 family protein [Lignipirellula cremea]QDU97530.1 hypothetical protein Pla8534_53780 [Lignipirellula cremea]